MILKRLLSLCLPLCLFISCLDTTTDSCSNVLCAGLPVLGFEVLQNGENVFDFGSYSGDDVVIDDTNAQTAVEFLSSINDRPALLIQDSDWTAGNYNYVVALGDDDSFTIRTTFELSDDSECCGGIPFLTAIEINDVEMNLAEVSGGVFTVNL